jgi:magnesium chelatase subunit H
MKLAVLYVGTSLLAPLSRAEKDINEQYGLGLEVMAHNCGAPFTRDEWQRIRRDITAADILFIIHVTDEENASRIKDALDQSESRQRAVIAFNCMPALMRCTRMGKLDFAKLMRANAERADSDRQDRASRNLVRRLGSWMSDYVKSTRDKRGGKSGGGHRKATQYLKIISRLPGILKVVPSAGRLRDVKNYLLLFCYFLQPTPRNIRMMLLHAIKSYAPVKAGRIKVEQPESQPVVGIYHPNAKSLFDTFEKYKKWYERARRRELKGDRTIGLLLMRPQIISDSRAHYDYLIQAIEDEELAVLPVISTFMDNRDACRRFFMNGDGNFDKARSRVSQVVSLTGFSFVGGPAMNDSDAAVEFLNELNAPLRSLVSLDVQTVESWRQSRAGLNPIQTAMQVAIPEIDGATEPFVFGGMTQGASEPIAIEERCRKIARRLARWNHLQVAPRDQLKIAFILYCFPPNKGNIGTAAEMDVFASLMEILSRLKSDGYKLDLPAGADELRDMLLGGNSEEQGQVANVEYRMEADEYRTHCPYVEEIEREWGRAPGQINSNGRELLIHGKSIGNLFVGVQPTFGYEGDPMKLLMAESGCPHHGFMAVYTYLEKVFRADAIVHVGTHGALEFMPGKQVGLSSNCWPDRLIGEMPNIYIYSVNNPSEGAIAKRRSAAELVSYLTPPIENAGLYKGLSSLKDLLNAYRQSECETERAQLFGAIEEAASELNL